VQVRIAGNPVADTTSAFVVSETGFSNRFYIPSADVETAEFRASGTTSHCPHKGDASYWSLADDSALDVAWSYPNPLEEATRVADYWSFDGPSVELSTD
jgi:uncharacterized protein (DUF427 family)